MRTGQTMYEAIISVDTNNNPVSAATLNTVLYRNGQIHETLSASLTDGENAIFAVQWSADTVGSYQVYCKNETTSVLYISDVYSVVADCEETAVVYVGL